MSRRYKIAWLCEALLVSRSGYYDWIKRRQDPGPRQLDNTRLRQRIREEFMNIDETWREIISIEINQLLFAYSLACLPESRRGTDRGDFPLFHDDFELVANSIRQNQMCVREYHLVMQAILPAASWRLNRNSRRDPGNSSRTRLSASLDALAPEP